MPFLYIHKFMLPAICCQISCIYTTFTCLLSRCPPSLFKGPRTRAANGDKGLGKGLGKGLCGGVGGKLGDARTNCRDGTEQAGTCLQRTTIGRRLQKVGYDRLPEYKPPALPSLSR